MKKSELIDRVAGDHGISRVKARAIVEGIFGTILEATIKGEECWIPEFGKFRMRDRAARRGQNPRTGAPMQIEAGRKLSFAPAQSVKERLKAAAR